MQLERRDNNGHYSPENCLWASPLTQANNKRNNRHLTFQDETLTLALWARRTGLGASVIWSRLRRGWTVEEALTTPPKQPRHQQ